MFSHYFILAYRTFLRFKGSFLINLTGLSTGLACALLIYLWVADELSVDKFHQHDRRLYQVMHNLTNGDGSIQTIEPTPGMLAQALSEAVPEVEQATSVVTAQWFHNKGVLSFGQKRLEAGGQFIGEAYFKMFTCPFIAGNEQGVFKDKHNIAISDHLARRLFGAAKEAIGKTIEWEQGEFSGFYQITGVFKKPPHQSTAPFDLLLNYERFLQQRPGLKDWGNSDPSTFLLLREGMDIARVEDKISGFLRAKSKGSSSTLFLQRYSDKYLYNRYENGQVAGGRIAYVRLFSVIALFILLIACVNFMNLSTAKAAGRMKEVGVKKAMGAGRETLIIQYFTESLLMAFVSLLLALLLVMLLLPAFNGITGKALAFRFEPKLIISFLALTCFTGIVSGSYPALYLSGFNPVAVLKGRLKGSPGELYIRKGLVVFQFAIAVILIAGILVVYAQIAYVQQKNLGYNRDQILLFEMEMNANGDSTFFAAGGAFEKKIETFLSEAKQIPGVAGGANFFHDLVGKHGGLQGVDWQAGGEDEKMDFANLQDGYDFIETLGIQIAQGRSFSRAFPNERAKVIFNEEAIKRMGLKDPIGKLVKVWGEEKEIIGVAKNFHFESLYEEVKPCIFQLEPRGHKIMVKMTGGSEQETISRLEKLYRRYNPGLAFNYTFLDNQYQALYAAEQRVGILARYFAGIAILISCLGLFGLAAFSAERRRKEIGIRKVLGATESSIIYLLSGSFTRPVLAGVLVALPVSYLLAKQWLEGFAYRIPLAPWYFVVAGLLAIGIALLTVGLQAAKAARANPAQSLQAE
jgi:ABC-type lipoprotein release transport system permease subunit